MGDDTTPTATPAEVPPDAQARALVAQIEGTGGVNAEARAWLAKPPTPEVLAKLAEMAAKSAAQ